MRIEEIEVKLGLFKGGVKQIEQNTNLSKEGKERAIANLKQEEALFKNQAAESLSSEWRALKSSYGEVLSGLAQAEQEESERWSYAKLEHERKFIEDRLKRTHNLQELEALYTEFESSGIPERKRALFEVVPEHALKYKSASLAKSSENALKQLCSTENMKEYQAKGEAVVKRAQELAGVTEQAAHYYYSEGVFSTENEFTRLMAGIRLTEQPVEGRIKTSLEIT